jgi:RHS repeat-associated protein
MHGSKRTTSVVVWMLVTQISLPAQPVRAFSTDSSTLPSGRGIVPAAGAAGGAAPATDPFTGAAASAIPIEVPPGTGGMTPQLALRYSSQARGDSWVGSGWSLGLPAITRSLRNGIPVYDDGADVFELDGQPLVPETTNPALPRRYHTLRESFIRIVHEANGTWTITRKDGVLLRFGVTTSARVSNAAGQVFQWLLEQQEDRHGNAFVASYDRRDPGTAYLATIRYTLHRSSGGALQSLDGNPAKDRRVEFVLESAARGDVAEGYRTGFLSRIAHRLDFIDVKVGATLVRRYDLRFASSPDTARSLLASVALYGNDADVASPRAPFVTSFAYHSNVAAGTTGWQLANWSWPAGITLVDASGQDKGVRLADVDGDARPDLVKALATMSNPDPKLATFSLSADSGIFLNIGTGFASVPSPLHRIPGFSGQNGQIPFSLAWQHAGASRTTGLDILDVTGDGRADLVGGVRDLDPASGVRALYGMPAWFRGSANGFVATADVGDVLDDDLWGINRSGVVDLYVFTATSGTTSGNARFADLTGDGLPELIVRGAEHRYSAIGGPPAAFASYGWSCLDQRITNYYFENRGELRFERAPVVDSPGSFCQSSLKRVATDFQHCDLDDYIGCAYKILYNEAQPVWFHGDPLLGNFPWTWLVNWEFGSLDVDLNGDGLADTLSASFDPYGYGAASTAWLNNGERGYLENPAWALPSNLYLYELGGTYSNDTGVRLADVNGDGRVDVVQAKAGGNRTTWLNDGDVNETPPTPWVASAAWTIPAGLEFVAANGADNGVRMLDLDGDGMTDLVRSANGANEFYRNRGSIPDLLKLVTNSLGGQTQYSYEASTQHDTTGGDGTPDLPFVVPVVASVSVSPSPGRPGNLTSTSTFDYEGGRYDAAAREFRGFAGVTETRPDGRLTDRVYHQTDALSGQLASETVLDAAGRQWLGINYTYSADATPPYASQLVRVDRREYDGQTTPRQSRTEFRYDAGGAIAHGNPTAIIEWGEISSAGTDVVPGDTRTTELSYLPNEPLHLVDRVKTRTVRTGGSPGAGTVVRESRFAYDGDATGVAPPAVGDLTRRIDVLADAVLPDPTTTFAYDPYGNLTSVTDPLANAGGNGGTTTTEYDATYHSFPTATVNALGHRTELSYATSPGCSVSHSAGAGLVGQRRSPNDLAASTAWGLCYDVFGRQVSESGPAGLASTTWSYIDTPLDVAMTESRKSSTNAFRTSTTHYDGLGRPIATDHTGPGGQTVYDANFVYDAVGRLVAQTQPGFGAPGAATLYEYDVADRVITATLPGGGRVHTRRYDRGAVERTDANGNVVRQQHDAFDRIVRVEEKNGSETYITRYDYDVSDQLTRITDHHGNSSTVSYDRLGRRSRLTEPDIGRRDFTYDGNGNVLTELVNGLETITWSYDKLGRPRTKRGTSLRNLAASSNIWVYDGAPNGIGMLSVRNDDDVHTYRVMNYDLLGRPSREKYTLFIANKGESFDFENSYDPLGQLLSRKHPTGTKIDYQRDARGYLTSIASGQPSPDASAIGWTADGHVASWWAPGGVVTTTSYDAETRRLAAIRVDSPGPGLLIDETLHYDDDDRVTSVIDGVGTNSMAFGYDPLDRLVRTTRFEAGVWTIRTNAYDAIGNMLCRDATGARCAGGTLLAYPFAANDPLQRATNHRATSVAGAASAYDVSGAVLTLGGRGFSYNALANVTEVWDGSTLALRASYDGNGRTYQLQSGSSGETQYLPTDDFEWGETSHQARVHVTLDGARIATHTMNFVPPVPPPGCAGHGPAAPGRDSSPFDFFAPGLAALLLLGARRGFRGIPVEKRARVLVATGTGTAFLLVALVPVPFARRGEAIAQSGVPSSVYYHGDHLGSVLVVTSANGARVGAPSSFEPWGRLIGGGALSTAFGFNGKRSAGNIYDYGARWYDPSMGRFLQPDPVIVDPYDPQGLSRYSYVRNDPVGRIDPTGAWSLSANAYAGQIGNSGFTGIVLGLGFSGGGSYSVSASALIGGIPVAQYAQALQVLGDLTAAVKVGSFQFFNQQGTTFSRTQLPDVGANAQSASWRTPQNLAVLDSLDPYVANLAAQHLSEMTEEGLDVRLTQGFRTYEVQNGYYAHGRTLPGDIVTNARGGESLHNFGLAYDVGVFDKGQYANRGRDPRYSRAGVLGEGVSDGIGAERLSWGGRWGKPDTPHFEFDGGLPLAEIRRRFEAGEPAF